MSSFAKQYRIEERRTSPNKVSTTLIPRRSNECLSPTMSSVTKQYRIEERRTFYVTAESDVSLSQWDSQSLNQIVRLADIPETEQAADVRRSHSLPDKHSFENGSEAPTRESPRRSAYLNRRGSNTGLSVRVPKSTSGSPRWGSPRSAIRPRILFYHKHDPHYGFTNFSPHPVVYKGKKYPTSEHLFQSFKFEHRPNLAEHIRTCSERPSVAFSEARRFDPEVRPDWKHVNIQKMDEALAHKFAQHSDLRAELLDTGDAELVEDSDKDAFWGIGADGRGRNELGKALERLRTQLREA